MKRVLATILYPIKFSFKEGIQIGTNVYFERIIREIGMKVNPRFYERQRNVSSIYAGTTPPELDQQLLITWTMQTYQDSRYAASYGFQNRKVQIEHLSDEMIASMDPKGELRKFLNSVAEHPRVVAHPRKNQLVMVSIDGSYD